MTHTEGPEPIFRPSPRYWDNQELGKGELMPPDHTYNVPKTVWRFGQRELDEYLARPGARLPLRVLAHGDSFDPNEHSPGTIVAVNQETLTTAVDVTITGFKDDDPTLLPPDKSIPYDKASVSRTMAYGKIGPLAYAQWTEWGIVAPYRKGRCLVIPGLIEKAGSKIVHFRDTVLYTGSITVGETVHTKVNYESLFRTNALEICANGRSETSKALFGFWPGWLGVPRPTS